LLLNQKLPVSLDTRRNTNAFEKMEQDRGDEKLENSSYKPLNLTVVSDGERNTVLKTIYEDK
jgi:hypothetical protein